MIAEYLLPGLISAIAARALINWWIERAPRLGLVGRDMNKPGEHLAVEAGGLWVILSSVFGVLIYIAIGAYTGRKLDMIPLLSIVIVLLLSGLLGFFDDILGWKKGISPLKRVLLTIPISLPLIAVKAGHSVVELPIVGLVDLGILYPLIVVPAGITGSSNAFNMIAGYNGLEALQGTILLSSAIILLASRGDLEAVGITIPVLSTILLFYLLYNKYPARVFPGNSFTYGIGAFYASLAIYWNFEKYAVYSYTLYFIELVLFIRGLKNGVYKENFGRVQPDGSLLPPYEKSYSITHLAIKTTIALKKKCYEIDVVKFITVLQLAICGISLLTVFLVI